MDIKTKPNLRRSLRIKSTQNPCTWNLPDLPFDILVNIISRLSIKLIITCKSLSKPINSFISHLQFSQLYLTNRSSLLYTLFVDDSSPDLFLQLIQLDTKEINNKRKNNGLVSELGLFNFDKLLPGASYKACEYYSMWGYCNGLLCILKFKSDVYNLFVINPVLGQFVKLPKPSVYHHGSFFAYGIGFCEVTSRYKVVRIISKYVGGSECMNSGEIFSIGYDKKWRSLEDGKIPYNMKRGSTPNPQSPMVAFRSALHWVVQPVRLSFMVQLEPNWGNGVCMCVFDVSEEKASAVAMPPGIDASHVMLSVFLDKLWVWDDGNHGDVSLWVMEDYGVKWSWTKQFVLKLSTMSRNISLSTLIPLTVTPEGVLVVSDSYRVFFYDMKKDKFLRVVQETEEATYPIPFVPSFVSLMNP